MYEQMDKLCKCMPIAMVEEQTKNLIIYTREKSRKKEMMREKEIEGYVY